MSQGRRTFSTSEWVDDQQDADNWRQRDRRDEPQQEHRGRRRRRLDEASGSRGAASRSRSSSSDSSPSPGEGGLTEMGKAMVIVVLLIVVAKSVEWAVHRHNKLNMFALRPEEVPCAALKRIEVMSHHGRGAPKLRKIKFGGSARQQHVNAGSISALQKLREGGICRLDVDIVKLKDGTLLVGHPLAMAQALKTKGDSWGAVPGRRETSQQAQLAQAAAAAVEGGDSTAALEVLRGMDREDFEAAVRRKFWLSDSETAAFPFPTVEDFLVAMSLYRCSSAQGGLKKLPELTVELKGAALCKESIDAVWKAARATSMGQRIAFVFREDAAQSEGPGQGQTGGGQTLMGYARKLSDDVQVFVGIRRPNHSTTTSTTTAAATTAAANPTADQGGAEGAEGGARHMLGPTDMMRGFLGAGGSTSQFQGVGGSMPQIDMLAGEGGKGYVDAMRRKGKKVIAWVVDEEAQLVVAAQAGVDAVVSDKPVAVKNLIYGLFHHGKCATNKAKNEL